MKKFILFLSLTLALSSQSYAMKNGGSDGDDSKKRQEAPTQPSSKKTPVQKKAKYPDIPVAQIHEILPAAETTVPNTQAVVPAGPDINQMPGSNVALALVFAMVSANPTDRSSFYDISLVCKYWQEIAKTTPEARAGFASQHMHYLRSQYNGLSYGLDLVPKPEALTTVLVKISNTLAHALTLLRNDRNNQEAHLLLKGFLPIIFSNLVNTTSLPNSLPILHQLNDAITAGLQLFIENILRTSLYARTEAQKIFKIITNISQHPDEEISTSDVDQCVQSLNTIIDIAADKINFIKGIAHHLKKYTEKISPQFLKDVIRSNFWANNRNFIRDTLDQQDALMAAIEIYGQAKQLARFLSEKITASKREVSDMQFDPMLMVTDYYVLTGIVDSSNPINHVIDIGIILNDRIVWWLIERVLFAMLPSKLVMPPLEALLPKLKYILPTQVSLAGMAQFFEKTFVDLLRSLTNQEIDIILQHLNGISVFAQMKHTTT